MGSVCFLPYFFYYFIILRNSYYYLVSLIVLHFRVYSLDHIFINISVVSFPALKIKAHISCTLMGFFAIYIQFLSFSFKTEDLKVTAVLPQPTAHFTYAMILILATMLPACKSHSLELWKLLILGNQRHKTE